MKIKDAFGKTAIDYAKKYAIPLVFSSKHKKDENALSAEKQLKEKLNRLVLQTKDPKSPYFERSVLAIAVAQKQKELIPYLLTAGYSPWKGDLQHQNAVITAIIMKDHNTAITLLSRTIPKSIKQNKLVNTFAHAIKYDQLKVLTKLLEVVDTKNMAKWSIEQTPLWYAIKFNRIKAVISIMRKMPIDSRQGDYLKENTKENTINKGYLLLAMQSNLSEISQLLISNKVDINLQDEKGRTALWYAADFKNSDIMYQLLQAHTQINLADNQNITPLIQAVIKNCYRCVEQLITFGADTKKQTQNGNNALMFAAQGKDKLVKLFIDDKREFNIKARNNNSSTALMLSIKSNCIKCVQLLLNKGANPKRKNKQGEDSFDLSKNKPEILTLLNNY